MTNTDAYLMLGLGVVTVILGGYALSLWLRLTQSRKTTAALESLED